MTNELDVYVSADHIEERIAELGGKITRYYKRDIDAGAKLVVVVVLKGAFMFAADLLRRIKLPLRVEFVQLKSYEKNSRTGRVSVKLNLQRKVEAREHVLIVEDIVDTGYTFQAMKALLMDEHPDNASIKCAALLSKKTGRSPEFDPDWYCFECDSGYYVSGFGLDDDEFFRNLPYVAKGIRQ